jgi:glycerophosphoryl diester phosphodiesterase
VIHLDWLIRPIAHRGLHDKAKGIIENTPSAIQAAIDADYGIEVDVQETGDGNAVVFHDHTLERLTKRTGLVRDHSSTELGRVRFKDTSNHMQSLPELLEQISGRVPLLVEIKSDWRTHGRFERHLADVLNGYDGNVAVQSFDPFAIKAFAQAAPDVPRGILAGPFLNPHFWGHLTPWKRFYMRHLLSAFIAKPHFVAYDIGALPSPAPWFWRRVLKRPLLTWTIRKDGQWQRAKREADAMIFEGFRP